MPSVKPPATHQPAIASADLADDVYRTATLGFYIHGEEVKTQEIVGKDGKPNITHHKDSDGLFSITQVMPDGAVEHWKQTDLMMNAETGVKVMAYERRNADGSVYVGANGRPQALIESVGTINTNQDIKANTKIVEGMNAHELFDKARDFGETWYQHAQQRAEANGLPMPDVVVGAHSMGAFTVGAITLKLHEHGLEPVRTIEIEPVGAGAGVEYLAGHYNANATPQQREQIAHFLAKNVSSFRAAGQSGMPGSLFQLPGGWREHANDMVGNTYEYGGTSDTAWLMTNHKLAVPANDLNKYGSAALRRTPEYDTPVSAFVHDTPLSVAEQYTADKLLDAFNTFTVVSRGHEAGDINTTRTDLHADPAPVEADLHQQNVKGREPRSYAQIRAQHASVEQAGDVSKAAPLPIAQPKAKAVPKQTEKMSPFHPPSV